MEDVVCVAPRTKEFFAVVEPMMLDISNLVTSGHSILGGHREEIGLTRPASSSSLPAILDYFGA
jgi:hypothetical protein